MWNGGRCRQCGHVRTIWLQLLSVWEAVQYLHALKGVGLLQLRRAHTHTHTQPCTNTHTQTIIDEQVHTY